MLVYQHAFFEVFSTQAEEAFNKSQFTFLKKQELSAQMLPTGTFLAEIRKAKNKKRKLNQFEIFNFGLQNLKFFPPNFRKTNNIKY